MAVLLPLSGANADLGLALQKAARLVLDQPGGPGVDMLDTASTAAGAEAAAHQALADGAGLILGPLTSAETAAAGPVAQAARVGMLAFTNDPAKARPGVWTLGITPAQQVQRLAAAARAAGRTRIAALLPQSDFGHAMADALGDATRTLGLPEPLIRRYEGGFAQITAATRDLSGYADRRGPIDAQIKAARARGDAEGRREAAELARRPVPPAPFEALLLAETGEKLSEILSLLPYYDIDPPQVKLLGPSLWASPVARRGNEGGLSGAWFAGPDPAARAGFETRFAEQFGASPPPLADLAFDAAAIARALAAGPGFSGAALTTPTGFTGTDGPLVLMPDGTVRRGLALFEIHREGPQMIEPAPSGV